MDAEQRLIDAMRDEPDSVEPGLVYADWLEEQGDPRAELVRVQLALCGPVDSAEELWRAPGPPPAPQKSRPY